MSAVPSRDTITPTFLAQGEQSVRDVAGWLADFFSRARESLMLATYDWRLGPESAAIVTAALAERAAAGVAIRIAYDADKPSFPRLDVGMDPAPGGTGRFVQSLGYPWRRIGGLKLMHHKYVVRDAGTPDGSVWTGSTNLTDDSWTLQENNIIQLASPALAAAYAYDFEELWSTGTFEGSGTFVPAPVVASVDGEEAIVRVLFAPGQGPEIDEIVAELVGNARHRIRICSMLLNSGALLGALRDQLRAGATPIDGIYDRTQMESVLLQWQTVPHNHWKIGAVHEIVARARLVGKDSTPYHPDTPHDFMHNKVLLVDDTVITGSYNFSHSAELNAENIVIVESAALAGAYSRYIDHLIRKYA